MFGHKLALSNSLYDKIRAVAEAKGYSSAEEFAMHVLEKSVAEAEESLSEEEVKKRLKGLGYLE